MFGIKKAVKEAIAEERQAAYEKLDMVAGEIRQPGYLKITEDGQLEVRWNQDSDFMQLATVIAALVCGELNQVVNNTIYNRGLANVVPGDAARASAILDQWANVVRELKTAQFHEFLENMNNEAGMPSEDVPLDDDEPAVSASNAFAPEDDEDEDEG